MSTYLHTATATEHTITGRCQYLCDLSLGLAGNETDADLAALGLVPVPEPVPEPVITEAQALASEHPELPGEVRASLAALAELVAIGVQLDLSAGLPGWPDIAAAVADAVASAADLAAVRALWSTQARADGHWRAVEYWCGSPQAAYRLAPELAAIGAAE